MDVILPESDVSTALVLLKCGLQMTCTQVT